MNPEPKSPPSDATGTPAVPAQPLIGAREIDGSCCPVLPVLFGASSFWLIIGSLLAIISSIKLHSAGFLASCPYITYGRVKPAADNILLYGFAIQAGLGLALWLTARLGRNVLHGGGLALVSGVFWNVGVALGTLGIFVGDNSSFEWFEFPRYATPILFCSYLGVAIAGLWTFKARLQPRLAVSQWYLLAAWFWFPWVYATAELLLLVNPVRGALQAVVAGWYGHQIFKVWLTFVALAAVFHLLPILTGKPFKNRALSLFAFWALVFISPWGGLISAVALPRWLSAVCVVAAVLTVVPTIAIAIVIWEGVSDSITLVRSKVGGSHLLAGTLAFLLSNVIAAVAAANNVVTSFTYIPVGLRWLDLLGFAGLVFAGSQCIAINVSGNGKWPAASLLNRHFQLAGAGVALLVIGLFGAGWAQGSGLNDPSVSIVASVRKTIPFLGISTLGWLLILLGNTMLLVSFVKYSVTAALAGCQSCSTTAMGAKAAGARL